MNFIAVESGGRILMVALSTRLLLFHFFFDELEFDAVSALGAFSV